MLLTTPGNAINSLQTTAHTVRKDNEKPDLQEIKYYTDTTRTNLITDISKWQKEVSRHRLLVSIVHSKNRLHVRVQKMSTHHRLMQTSGQLEQLISISELTSCTIPVHSRALSGQTVRVHDTADNKSDAARTIDIGIDGQAPIVTVTDTGSGTNPELSSSQRRISSQKSGRQQSLQHREQIPMVSSSERYQKQTSPMSLHSMMNHVVSQIQIMPLSLRQNLLHSHRQIKSPFLVLISQLKLSLTVSRTTPETSLVVSTHLILSDVSLRPTWILFQPSRPTRLHFKQLWQQTSMATLSENATNATCFRGILSNNITTLVTNQYNASNANTLNWSTPATLKNTSTPNTNGYYYFSNIAGNTLSINNTPTGTGSKAVIVEGGNIQINSNIDYSGTRQDSHPHSTKEHHHKHRR